MDESSQASSSSHNPLLLTILTAIFLCISHLFVGSLARSFFRLSPPPKMMEPKQLRYHQIRSEEGDQGDSHNNIDVPVQVSLPEGYPVTPSLLPDKINALLTSQVRGGPSASSARGMRRGGWLAMARNTTDL